MVGISDLTVLLGTMEPVLFPGVYGYASLPPGEGVPVGVVPFATMAEAEGMTLVALATELAAAGVVHQGGWARISLTVQSDLAAVGLTAAFTGALGARGISANVVAGYHHDHLFVQWDRRDEAVAALRAMGGV